MQEFEGLMVGFWFDAHGFFRKGRRKKMVLVLLGCSAARVFSGYKMNEECRYKSIRHEWSVKIVRLQFACCLVGHFGWLSYQIPYKWFYLNFKILLISLFDF